MKTHQTAVTNEPVREFREFALSSGLVLESDEPYSDGQWHYVRVEGAKANEKKSGAYKLSLDGRANGFVKNFKDVGLGGPWKATGITTSLRDQKLNEEMARRRRAIDIAELAVKQQQAASKADSEFASGGESAEEHAYLQRKGVGAFGVRVSGQKLLVPLRNMAGEITSLQAIYETAEVPKSYTKNGRKAGCFHVIGELANAKIVLFAEGYSTGASLFMATGYPVVVTFDSGNMPVVGQALSETLPPETIKLWCGDNDVHYVARAEKKLRDKGLDGLLSHPLVMDGQRHSRGAEWYEFSQVDGAHEVPRLTGKAGRGEIPIISWTIHNAGKEKALEAHALVPNSMVCMPVFKDDAGLPTDFNDMHQKHGLQAVKQLVDMAVLAHKSEHGIIDSVSDSGGAVSIENPPLVSSVGNASCLDGPNPIALTVTQARAREAARMITSAAGQEEKGAGILEAGSFARLLKKKDGEFVSAILCDESRNNALFAQAVLSPGARAFVPAPVVASAQSCMDEIGNPAQIRVGGVSVRPGDLMSPVSVGKVLTVSRGLTVQSAGPNTVIIHQNEMLGEVPRVGEVVRIEYRQDKTRGVLTKPCEKSSTLER